MQGSRLLGVIFWKLEPAAEGRGESSHFFWLDLALNLEIAIMTLTEIIQIEMVVGTSEMAHFILMPRFPRI